MIFAVASGYDLAIVVVLVLFGLCLLLIVGKLTFTVRGIKVVAEKTEQHAADVKKTVGEANGNGDVTTMQARILGELAEVDRKVDNVNSRLDERTHVVRHGRAEPEELAVYTQDRMHDVLTALAVLKLQLDTLWRFLKDDYQLPDLPSIAAPTTEE